MNPENFEKLCNLDKFIGKDLWIKCVDTEYGHGFYVYLRVLDKLNNGYLVNKVPEFTVMDFAGCSDKTLFATLSGSLNAPYGRYALYTPFEAYTTGELLGNGHEYDEDPYGIDSVTLDNLAGTDLWVKVQNRSDADLYHGTYYINIISHTGRVIKYYSVGAAHIDEGMGFYLMDDNSIRAVLSAVRTDYLGDWELYQPPVVYTTEEISQIIGVDL